MAVALLDYINEYKDFDEMNTFLESMNKDVWRAYTAYENEIRVANQKFYLEGADDEPLLEAAENNFFATIGRKIRELAEKVRKFFTNIIAKIKGEDPNTELAKAQKVLKENPELKDKILISVEKGQITLADVAKYEKDVETLVELIKKNQIDEKSFKARFAKITEDFQKNGTKILAFTGTVASIIAIVPNIMKACGETRKSMENFNKWTDDVEKSLKHHTLNDPSLIRCVVNAFKSASGVHVKEYQERVSLLHRLVVALRKIGANKLADNANKLDEKIIDSGAKIVEKRRKIVGEIEKDTAEYTEKIKNKLPIEKTTEEKEAEKKKNKEEDEKNTILRQANQKPPVNVYVNVQQDKDGTFRQKDDKKNNGGKKNGGKNK